MLLAASAVAQESKEFSFPDEKEDSLNSLSIVPLKSARARRVVEKVIRRYQKDLKVIKEGHKYLVSATFRQDSLESFTAQCVVSQYFDGKTMRLTQFKGKARRPTDRYDINIRYRNDYEDRNDTLVLNRTIIAWEAGDTEIRARVTRQE